MNKAAAIGLVFWILGSALLWGVVLRRSAPWWFLFWIGSMTMIATLGELGFGATPPWRFIGENASVFLLLLCYWLHTYKSNTPEHIRYRVRH